MKKASYAAETVVALRLGTGEQLLAVRALSPADISAGTQRSSELQYTADSQVVRAPVYCKCHTGWGGPKTKDEGRKKENRRCKKENRAGPSAGSTWRVHSASLLIPGSNYSMLRVVTPRGRHSSGMQRVVVLVVVALSVVIGEN